MRRIALMSRRPQATRCHGLFSVSSEILLGLRASPLPAANAANRISARTGPWGGVVKVTPVAIIGAGTRGLSIAAHLAERGISRNRIFGQPMSFWTERSRRGQPALSEVLLFWYEPVGTSSGICILADYNRPRGLETFEPCSIGNFADYGQWFQQHNVPWCESVDVRQ